MDKTLSNKDKEENEKNSENIEKMKSTYNEK